MLTDKQIEAARKALQERKSEDLKKRILLHQYKLDMLNSKRWYLPFRMVHKHEFPSGEVQPNQYYPHPCGIVIDGSGAPVALPDSEKITKETALYWFTRFLALNEANLTEYSRGDWTGEAISAAEARELQKMYLERIRDYHDHPERYNTEAQHGTGEGRRYFLPDDY